MNGIPGEMDPEIKKRKKRAAMPSAAPLGNANARKKIPPKNAL